MKIYQKLKGIFAGESGGEKDSEADSRGDRRPGRQSSSADSRGQESASSRRGGGRSGRRSRNRGRGRGSAGGGGQDRERENQGGNRSSGAEGSQAASGQKQTEHGRHSGESDSRQGDRGKSRGRGRGDRSRSGRAYSGDGQSAGGDDSRERHRQQRESRSGDKRGPRRGRIRRSGGRKRSDLGGVAQRIEFPELLDLDRESEQFVNNEFRPLGLSDEIVMALACNRFRTPTDIQHEVIPVGVAGRDILGQAKTGTGKTVAFLMPIFQHLDHDLKAVQALIVVPTRELCRQVSWEARRFSRSFDFKVMSIYGGTSVKSEIDELRQTPGQIVVGTPGRLLDHISKRNIDLSKLNTLVLDEADRMFDIGFRDDIIKIIKACPEKRQIMLLSATMDDNVEYLGRRFMHDPVKLYVSKDEITVESIWQRYIPVERNRKMDTLSRLLRQQNPTQSIVFTNTKRMSDVVALRLGKQGFKARCIHSDLSQNKRERIMDDFRTGKIEHLIATDVAARGLDITGISHVINYDIPDNAEDYVHRVGRTGRMGAAGKAFTFVTSGEGEQLTKVETFINKLIEDWEVGDGDGGGGS